MPQRADPPPPDASSETLAVLELGGGFVTRDGFEAPHLGGWLGGAVQLQSWAFGIRASLAARRTDHGGGVSADVIETRWTGSVRRDLLAARSPWVLQLGMDLGLFVARVEGLMSDQARTGYMASPVASVSVVGGVQLSANGSTRLRLLLGPGLDILWNRSRIRVAGSQVYDSGRLRPRTDLALALVF